MVKKAVPKKKAALKKKAVPKKASSPVAPSHPLMLDGHEYDRTKTTAHVFDRLKSSCLGLDAVLKAGFTDGRGTNHRLPSYSTMMKWLDEDATLSERYARAHEAQAEFLAHEALEIVDNVGSVVLVDGVPLVVDGKPVMAVTNEAISHARLRLDARKFLMSKLKPKKYGDRVENVHSGQIGLAQILSDLDGKSSGLPEP